MIFYRYSIAIIIRRISFAGLSVAFLCFLSSCRKFIEVDPPKTSINEENVFENDVSAAAVLTGIYTNLSNQGITSANLPGLSLFGGLSSDELTLYNKNDQLLTAYNTNNLTPTNTGTNTDFWISTYQIIYKLNDALEGVSSSKGISGNVKKQLLGEAKFMRSFCYLYLVALYGDVPLVLTTDYKTNSVIGRTNSSDVYLQIISDLKSAVELLNPSYVEADLVSNSLDTERTRPNKWAAVALLARAHLYFGDFDAAQSEASDVIMNTSIYSLESIDNTFDIASKETIWALQPTDVGPNSNTPEGRLFVLPTSGPRMPDYPVFLSNSVFNSFEDKDLRKTRWVGKVSVRVSGQGDSTEEITYRYPFKYKIGAIIAQSSEYSVVIRLAEMYLIRAEARIQKGELAAGISDLNKLRARARDESMPTSEQLPDLSLGLPKQDALNALVHERLVELFSEWGHRWFDLKRLKLSDAILKPIKGGDWQSTDVLYPIPEYEITANPSLQGHQNPGY
jgi:hypothetical protein